MERIETCLFRRAREFDMREDVEGDVRESVESGCRGFREAKESGTERMVGGRREMRIEPIEAMTISP
jgi:hypothetical protein